MKVRKLQAPKARKIPGVRKIVVSQGKGAVEGKANCYHVKVYLDDIESLMKVAKSKEVGTKDGSLQGPYTILVAESDDHSATLPGLEFLSFER